MMKISRILFVFLTILFTFAISGCFGGGDSDSNGGSGKNGSSSSSKSKIFRHGRGADSKSLDPAEISDGESVKVIYQIFESLLTFKADSTEVIPCLAESYEVSDDSRIFTFTIRKGVKFHDGTPLNAEAVKYSLERMTLGTDLPSGLTASPYQFLYADVKEVRIEGEDRVVVELNQPDVTFALNFAMFPVSIVSPTAVKKDIEKFGRAPVGTGPFRFVKWQESDGLILLEKNPDYWGEKAKLDKLIFRSVLDNKVRARLLIKGELDSIDGISFSDINVLKSDANITVHTQPGMNICYLALNTKKHPAFAKVKVRQAIMHAIKRSDINKGAYNDFGSPAHCPVPPTVLGHWTSPELTEYDLAKAKQLMKEAGYESGFKFKLNIMTNPRAYLPDPQATAVLIASQLKQIGIDVQIESNDWNKHLEIGNRLELEAIIMGWNTDNGDPDNFVKTFFSEESTTPGAASNYSEYIDPDVQRWLREGRAEQDFQKRKTIYQKLMERVLTDAPVIPLMHTTQVIAYRDNALDLKLHPLDHVYFKTVNMR